MTLTEPRYTDFDLSTLAKPDASAFELEGLTELADLVGSVSKYGEILQIDQATRLAIYESRFADAQEAKSLAEAIGTLPGPAESIHILIGAKHSMGHVIPAIIAIASPATIEELTVSTLSFSKRNGIDLAAAMDAGLVKKLTLVASHYFSKTSPQIFDPSKIILEERGATVLTPRQHCKLILAKLSDGRYVTAEGSANLRSADVIEQVTLFGDPAVYEFHHGWIQRLIDKEKEAKK